MSDLKKIRNFAIIAHIDHGKSTLADRFLEICRAVPERELVEQYLDRLEIERERGITIKAQAARLNYQGYVLNLIDTPGHVDFTYEVSRALAACEGALLVVDATQGVEAQTVANALLALENNLEIVPVINKIDLPNAEPEKVAKEIEESLGLPAREALYVSAKTGENVEMLLQTLIEKIPPPRGSREAPLRALLFDSFYNPYRGVVVLIRAFDGIIRPGMEIKLMGEGSEFTVDEVGFLLPGLSPQAELQAGEVGYLMANIKNVSQTRIGDTITEVGRAASQPLPGYKRPKPLVFSGLYPLLSGDYERLRDSLAKLALNDPSFQYQPETSEALGFGFRCGFLGLLHMEIVKERLEREFGLELLATAPNVAYVVNLKNGKKIEVNNPAKFPQLGEIKSIEEPFVSAVIITPREFIGPVMELSTERRGEQTGMLFLSPTRVELKYNFPLAEIIFDFYDQLKSKTRGYASFDYELAGYRESDLVKLEVLIGGEVVDALSLITHRDKAYYRGRELVNKLKGLIPRQLFDVPVQAAVWGKPIARETIKALRKDVLAKCYGGDVTRKRKLLEKQKEGKKRLKQLGKVEVPQEAFIEILKA